jgi:glycosyltransferase involved in cell wall biosynthesis
MQKNRICVLIPAYNCDVTIKEVITSILQYNTDIIVVNDGSTDKTEAIVKEMNNIILISYPENKGKGFALKTGFYKALELGFDAAITMDGDGQHLAKDFPVFLEFGRKEPDMLLIGTRNFNNINISKSSLNANKFSNFWFAAQTFIKLPDTQSGFRLYPLWKMKKMKPYTNRYEAETELLVRCAWRGIRLCSIPISAYYPPENEYISHFRPQKDFARISLLNTCLCIIALFYGYPLILYHSILRKIEDYKDLKEYRKNDY